MATRATMMSGRSTAWGLAAERGPDWLFVRLEAAPGQPAGDLADSIWSMIREHHASRVLLELDRVDAVDESLVGAIAEVGTRVQREGGLIRACGLSEPNLARLPAAAPLAAVPHFENRSEAIGTRGCGATRCG